MSKTIAVVGGQGAIGKKVCEALVKGGVADRVLCMDMRTTGAIAGVEERVVDIYDPQGFEAALEGVDVVFNAVGPYLSHGTTVAEACLAAGAHYGDACADVPVTNALLKMNEQFKAKGLSLVTGLGFSPGLTNLVVRQLATEFDELERADLAFWVRGGSDITGGETGTVKDYITQEFGPVESFEDGGMVTMQGFVDGAEEIDVEGARISVYYAGHTEQLTVPQFIPGFNTVTLKGEVLPVGLSRLVAKAVDMGLASEEEIEVGGHKVTPLQFVMSYMFSETASQSYDLGSLDMPDGLQVRVTGKINGGEQTRVVQILFGPYEDCMEIGTGYPAAVAAEFLVTGDIDLRGAYAPEALDAALAEKLIQASVDRCPEGTRIINA